MTSALRQAVLALPTRLEFVDLRVLIPAMGELAQSHSVNQLAAEAVAAATYLETSIEVGVDTPQIRTTASAEHLEYRVIG